MAGVPKVPPAPEFVSANTNSITIDVLESENANGSPISRYQIWRDIGENV